jgi:hypothetical protein
MRNFARQLVAYEAGRNRSSSATAPAAFDVCEKLRSPLVALMGNAGFRALLSRSLALANAEVPWLRAVHVKGDGSLEGLAELATQVEPVQFADGRVILTAQLLGLLVAFIGEDLTVRLVREVWPKVSLNDLRFGNGDKNEKTK